MFDSNAAFTSCVCISGASLMAQIVKKLPANAETWVQSLGWEDPLKKEMANHSVFLPGKSLGQRSLVGYSPWGCKEWDTTERLTFFTFTLLFTTIINNRIIIIATTYWVLFFN